MSKEIIYNNPDQAVEKTEVLIPQELKTKLLGIDEVKKLERFGEDCLKKSVENREQVFSPNQTKWFFDLTDMAFERCAQIVNNEKYEEYNVR